MMKKKDIRKNQIIDLAIEMFIANSIQNTTLKDIARAAGVGEATMYRYFGEKSGLVISAGIKLQADIRQLFIKQDEGPYDFTFFEDFFNTFYDVYKTNHYYFKVLKDFDVYFFSNNIDISKYIPANNSARDTFRRAYFDALIGGLVREVMDLDTFYTASVYSIIELCKKLADSDFKKKASRRSLQIIRKQIDMVIYYLKK